MTRARDVSDVASTWKTYTPVVTQLGTLSLSSHNCRYTQQGKIVIVRGIIVIGQSGTAGNQVDITLPPIPAINTPASLIGALSISNSNTTVYTHLLPLLTSTTKFSGLTTSGDYFGRSPSFGVSNGCVIFFGFSYEVA